MKKASPDLRAIRKKYGTIKPFEKLKVTGAMSVCIETAVFIECLNALGADIRLSSCNAVFTQDHAAAGMAAAGSAAVFAWQGAIFEEAWWCAEMALTWPDGSGPDLVMDDGDDLMRMVRQGVAVEEEPSLLDRKPASLEEKCLQDRLRLAWQETPGKWTRIATKIRHGSEEIARSVNRLYRLHKKECHHNHVY